MKNALKYGFMLSFEIYTRKLIKKGNPFKENLKQYKIFEEMKTLYDEQVKDMNKVCRIAKKLCE